MICWRTYSVGGVIIGVDRDPTEFPFCAASHHGRIPWSKERLTLPCSHQPRYSQWEIAVMEVAVMRITRRLGLSFIGAAFMGLGLGPSPITGPAQAQDKELVIFAAASLKNALDEAAAGFVKQTGKPAPKISYAASNTLAKQIEAGAPADVFVSADLDWMDYLAQKNLIRPETRVNLLGNRIVLVAPKNEAKPITIGPGFDLASTLGSGKLAMGNIDAVPAGKYGKAALEKLGAWNGVKGQIAQADNVRGALLLVSRGEAPLGIVYQTDAASDANVTIVGTFPEDSHPPIIYPVAVTKDSSNPDASGFVAYLRSPGAKPAFEKQGFTILNKPASSS
jgi:molybdate transport system substrate-binding protein